MDWTSLCCQTRYSVYFDRIHLDWSYRIQNVPMYSQCTRNSICRMHTYPVRNNRLSSVKFPNVFKDPSDVIKDLIYFRKVEHTMFWEFLGFGLAAHLPRTNLKIYILLFWLELMSNINRLNCSISLWGLRPWGYKCFQLL